MDKTVEFVIKRQAGPGAESFYETFEIPYTPGMNVISALQSIQADPRTADGRPTTAVSWDCSCLEEVCGACTMVINGKVRQSCTALVDKIAERPIRLEPMTKFPVVRDLMVDRTRMFDSLRKVRAWIPIDGTYDLGPGPRMSPEVAEKRYKFSECMTCGCCVEACPQYVPGPDGFIGPQAIAQARLFNLHPTGALNKSERIEALMGEGGIQNCGNAQACVEVCPKEIPLTEAIAEMNREVTVHTLKKLVGIAR